MSELYDYFAPCPKGLEGPLAKELEDMGADVPVSRTAGVAFCGTLELGYRACLWSRIATRILLQLDRFPAPGPEELYRGALDFPFEDHFSVSETFAVEFTSTLSVITNTNYGDLNVKDAIADRFRNRMGVRPSVDRERPDIRFHMHVHEETAFLYLDMSGERLHRRSWRAQAQDAPLKENLAAGILLLARWPETVAAGGGLVDPMCGSGTLLVEAALMALDVAPGLMRGTFGFEHWAFHRPSVWDPIFQEALQRDRRKAGLSVPIEGSDDDEYAVQAALRNLDEAGVKGATVQRRELAMAEPVGDVPGIVVTNPPYGVRMQPGASLDLLYQRIGSTLKTRFPKWTGFIFTGNAEASRHVGLRTTRRYPLFNGALECRLLEIPILPVKVFDRSETDANESDLTSDAPAAAVPVQNTSGAESSGRPLSVLAEGASDTAFANRIRKNLESLRKWRKREDVTCYRLYDADIPEYAFTIDVYDKWVHVQESERPSTVPPLKAEARLHEALAGIGQVLELPSSNIFVKQRFRQRGNQQYGRFGSSGTFVPVNEEGLQFLVNLTDYFDAGLFLDHRPIRRMIRETALRKHFLNLFAYTGSASVHAAAGGALTTTTVDLSGTYLDWAERNMVLNGFKGPRHMFVETDVMAWLDRTTDSYDLVFLDPPTFSNSKSMRGTFDVQRDHVPMIRQIMRLLAPGGVLIFTNNFRRFKLDTEALSDLEIQDITRQSIPPDFARDPKAHQAFTLRVKPA